MRFSSTEIYCYKQVVMNPFDHDTLTFINTLDSDMERFQHVWKNKIEILSTYINDGLKVQSIEKGRNKLLYRRCKCANCKYVEKYTFDFQSNNFIIEATAAKRCDCSQRKSVSVNKKRNLKYLISKMITDSTTSECILQIKKTVSEENSKSTSVPQYYVQKDFAIKRAIDRLKRKRTFMLDISDIEYHTKDIQKCRFLNDKNHREKEQNLKELEHRANKRRKQNLKDVENKDITFKFSVTNAASVTPSNEDILIVAEAIETRACAPKYVEDPRTVIAPVTNTTVTTENVENITGIVNQSSLNFFTSVIKLHDDDDVDDDEYDKENKKSSINTEVMKATHNRGEKKSGPPATDVSDISAERKLARKSIGRRDMKSITAAAVTTSSTTDISSSSTVAAKTCATETMTLAEAIKQSKAMLHPNIDPTELGPSRQEQFQDMTSTLMNAVNKNQGLTIYACGLPGTGKTMVVGNAIQYVQEQFAGDNTFRRVYIQGTAIDSQLLYINIAVQLHIVSEELVSSRSSCYKNIKDKVITLLSASKSRSKTPIPMTLLYVDEIDQAPHEDIRTLMNISSEQNSKLIIIGTGNNVSLPQELLLFSNPTIVPFHEFRKEQLIEIMQQRIFGGICGLNGFTLIATKLLGRQTGCARNAIQILNQALEFATERGVDRNETFWADASKKPAEEFIKLADVAHVLNEIGIGANREPDQVANLSMMARIFVTAMILYDMGITSPASRFALKNNYINFLVELHMNAEADGVTQMTTDRLLEELYDGGIIVGGHGVFGRHKCFNRDTNANKREFRLMVTPINVLRCLGLEKALKRRLQEHFKAKAATENIKYLIV